MHTCSLLYTNVLIAYLMSGFFLPATLSKKQNKKKIVPLSLAKLGIFCLFIAAGILVSWISKVLINLSGRRPKPAYELLSGILVVTVSSRNNQKCQMDKRR